jgi:hypothetical protein
VCRETGGAANHVADDQDRRALDRGARDVGRQTAERARTWRWRGRVRRPIAAAGVDGDRPPAISASAIAAQRATPM